MWLLIALAAVFGFIAYLFRDDVDDPRNEPSRCPSCGFKAVTPRYGQDFRRVSYFICDACGKTFKRDEV